MGMLAFKEILLGNLVAEYAGKNYEVVNICLDRNVADLESADEVLYEIPFEEIRFFAGEEEVCEVTAEDEREMKLTRLQPSQ